MFCSLIENIFENTISNILTEAFNKEFSLTSRPRLIALPPKLSNGYTQSSLINLSFKNKPETIKSENNNLEPNKSDANKSEANKSKHDLNSVTNEKNDSRSRSPTISIKSIEVS
jgi:hypothetical protein